MKITIELDSLDELSKITDGVCIAPGVCTKEDIAESAAKEEKPTPTIAAPTTPIATTQTESTAPTAPTAPATPATPTAPATPATPTVQTSTTSYTLDDLAAAAVALMDAGRQTDLQALLRKYGVNSLPEMDKSQYGAFATDLRGMGAQI